MLMEADVEGLIGAGRYERQGDRSTYRNGYRDRALDTRLGSPQKPTCSEISSAGSTVRVTVLPCPSTFHEWKIGLLICYDVEFPETIRSVALTGADLILVPTALTGEYPCVPDFIVPARAVENQIFVAYCNHAGTEGETRFIGKSRLAGPDDPAIAAAGDGECLLIATITQEAIAASAPVFPYRTDRRPSLYAGLIQACHPERPPGTRVIEKRRPSLSAPSPRSLSGPKARAPVRRRVDGRAPSGNRGSDQLAARRPARHTEMAMAQA